LAAPAFANNPPPVSLVTCEQRFGADALTSIQLFQGQVRLAADLRDVAQAQLSRNLRDARANFIGCTAVVLAG
jgi:hypothetical protein